MFKEEEPDNNSSVQWIREHFFIVNISLNSNKADFRPFFESAVKY